MATTAELIASITGARGQREEEDYITYSPSSLWKVFACPRRAFWDIRSPLSENRDWYLTAEHGNAIHEMLVDMIKKSGHWRGDEVRGSNAEYGVSYRIDVLFDDGELVVPMEIKSANPRTFKQYAVTPHNAHLQQLMCYLGFHRPEPYPYGYLLYYNKAYDTLAMHKVPYDDAFFKEILGKIAMIQSYIDTNTCPEEKGTDCKWCPYTERCKELEGSQ
jgi:CRISPR/Cas system-associated exonuclease Cas4 (RecB family)